MTRRADLLLMGLLGARTDDPLQSDDLVEGYMGADVEETQHNSLGRSHGLVALTRDDDDAVNLALERVDPVGHELAIDSRASITKVLRISLLTACEGCIAQVVLESQLDSC